MDHTNHSNLCLCLIKIPHVEEAHDREMYRNAQFCVKNVILYIKENSKYLSFYSGHYNLHIKKLNLVKRNKYKITRVC
jgi:hypothetical protein